MFGVVEDVFDAVVDLYSRNYGTESKIEGLFGSATKLSAENNPDLYNEIKSVYDDVLDVVTSQEHEMPDLYILDNASAQTFAYIPGMDVVLMSAAGIEKYGLELSKGPIAHEFAHAILYKEDSAIEINADRLNKMLKQGLGEQCRLDESIGLRRAISDLAGEPPKLQSLVTALGKSSAEINDNLSRTKSGTRVISQECSQGVVMTMEKIAEASRVNETVSDSLAVLAGQGENLRGFLQLFEEHDSNNELSTHPGLEDRIHLISVIEANPDTFKAQLIDQITKPSVEECTLMSMFGSACSRDSVSANEEHYDLDVTNVTVLAPR